MLKVIAGKAEKVDQNELAQAVAAAAGEGAAALAAVAGVYPQSVKYAGGAYFCLTRTTEGKRLAVVGKGEAAESFIGETLSGVKFCPLSTENTAALREAFPWTGPVPIGRRASFGVGDRLGVATPGHLRAFAGREIFPVLAQQSMRELGRTGRTARDVIDAAGWGAFEAGYSGSFAADADHIKKIEEVLDCYRLGFTMFTVDASEHIDLAAVRLSDDQALARFRKLPAAGELKSRYAGQSWRFSKGDLKVEVAFGAAELARTALVYHPAVEYMAQLYHELKAASGGEAEGNFDFEVSVDETETDTTERDHLFVALELAARGVKCQSLAPKFTGQFQKGIDYIGDRAKFERQFAAHALIAEKLGGYKISVHSGSDKFSIFPQVGRYTEGYFHLKTAGTSWLEAVRVIAEKNARLYRSLHKFALERFETDRASYHVTTDLAAIPPVDSLPDSALPGLLDQINPRQLLHITYGSLLSSRDPDGKYLFRDEIYGTLYDYEETYYEMLHRHLGRHLDTLGVKGQDRGVL